MKRAILSLAMAAGLLVPVAFSHVLPASADYSDALPVCSLQPADPPDQPYVKVTGTDHGYTFGLACSNGGNLQVKAAYNTSTQQASERLTGDAGTMEATWTCPTDPWGAPVGQVTTCVKNSSAGPDTALFDLLLSHPTLPFSVQLLNGQGHQTLASQLQSALQQAQTPQVKLGTITNPTCLVCQSAAETPVNLGTISTTCVVCTVLPANPNHDIPK
jgi:hypothetical protein